MSADVRVHGMHDRFRKNPRATPDWLVTITTLRPARLNARMASMLYGNSSTRSGDRDSPLLR